MTSYDVLVIGSGGGAKIATPASKLGHRVALIESGPLGGTCLNRGCIPSKMLIHAADVAHTIDTASRFQVNPSSYSVDFETLVTRVSDTIDQESASIGPKHEENPNLDWYQGHARFIDDHTVMVNSEKIHAEKIFIATGSRPFIPEIPGLSETPFLTSKEALRLSTQPKKLIVLGGGYIATELAYYFAGLGTEVHVIARSSLIKQEDQQVQQEFDRVFSTICQVHRHTQTNSIAHDGNQFVVECHNAEQGTFQLEADQLLVATGVIPNSDDLGLENTQITCNPKGFIEADPYLRTKAPHVWAFGDVVGNYLFRHSANFEGEYLLETVIHGESASPIDYEGMPHAVFSFPQVAGVGPTEEELQEQEVEYVAGVNPFSSSAMGMALRSDHGFVKLLVERGTRKILGCHIVGHEASTLIHQVIPLIRLGGVLEDLLYMVHIHPALSELIRNAARKARNELLQQGDIMPRRLEIK